MTPASSQLKWDTLLPICTALPGSTTEDPALAVSRRRPARTTVARRRQLKGSNTSCLPGSPSGLGVVEGILVPSLVGFGTPGAAPVPAVRHQLRVAAHPPLDRQRAALNGSIDPLLKAHVLGRGLMTVRTRHS